MREVSSNKISSLFLFLSTHPKPLKVVDPDHPLAALVRKAQADNKLATTQMAEAAAVRASQIEYPSDCKYIILKIVRM